jgi:hypothetical protein
MGGLSSSVLTPCRKHPRGFADTYSASTFQKFTFADVLDDQHFPASDARGEAFNIVMSLTTTVPYRPQRATGYIVYSIYAAQLLSARMPVKSILYPIDTIGKHLGFSQEKLLMQASLLKSFALMELAALAVLALLALLSFLVFYGVGDRFIYSAGMRFTRMSRRKYYRANSYILMRSPALMFR